MADFTLKKRKSFQFALEDEPGKVYTLPALSSLSFDEAQLMAKFGSERSIVKQGGMIKEFILKHAPELADKGLGDMEFYEIFNAYGIASEKEKEKVGES